MPISGMHGFSKSVEVRRRRVGWQHLGADCEFANLVDSARSAPTCSVRSAETCARKTAPVQQCAQLVTSLVDILDHARLRNIAAYARCSSVHRERSVTLTDVRSNSPKPSQLCVSR